MVPDNVPARAESPGDRSRDTEGYRFSPWKRVLCAVALLMVGGGLVLEIVARGGEKAAARTAQVREPAEEHTQPGDDRFMPRSALVPGGFPESDAPLPRPDEPVVAQVAGKTPWPGALLRGGAGFLVGFLVGFALRTLFKVTLVVAGLIILALVGASSAGWIDVNWEVVQAQLSQWGAAIEAEVASVKSFVIGSLPSVGLAGIGLFAGFKRK